MLFVGSQRLGAGLDLETAIHHRLAAQTLELGLGADGIPGCKQLGGGEGTELGQRAAPGSLHDLLPERVVGRGRLGRQHLAHAAAAAHHGLGEQPPGDGGEDELLDAHAPALWPMMVMLLASPPKAAMLARTHCRAAS